MWIKILQVKQKLMHSILQMCEYTMNIQRKRILKQRREQTLLNAQGRKLPEEYFLTALKASHKLIGP